ncbi:MAG: beta-glucosidase [Cyanobacterium sp. T60_A2020_053]|nr:beta-glucosidase [Cyanobacterium sp. T60_A2020_053]
MLKSLSELSLKEKIGQLIIARTTGHLFDHQIQYPAWEATNQQLQTWLGEYNLGGVILLGGSAAEVKMRTSQLQQWANLPLLICTDIEEGVGQRFTGASCFPPPMALAQIAKTNLDLATKYAYEMGKITAQEALAIGINWILAPVTDVNNNPDNPVINVRAFGEDAPTVAQLTSAFIKGTQNYPILNTAKHFPGHGDTATDSHLTLPVITHGEGRLNNLELIPFEEAIKSGVDAIMTAHLLVNAYDSQKPATISPTILTNLLRQKMGFEGLIVTDALIMGGITQYASPPEVALSALVAGADILLMPENPPVIIDYLVEAVKKGDVSESRIDASVTKILQAKQKLSTSEKNSIPQNFNQISNKVALTIVNDILKQSNHLQGNIPIKPVAEGINIIIVDDVLNCDFLPRQTPAVILPQIKGYQTQIFDSRTFYLLEMVNFEQPFILQIFQRGNPFKGAVSLSHSSQKIYQKLLQSPQIQGVLLYGSPYLQSWVKQYIPSYLPFGFSYGQIEGAQKSLCKVMLQISTDDDIKTGEFM